MIREMIRDDLKKVNTIVGSVFNENDCKNAKNQIKFHFKCLENNIDDGTDYWVLEIDEEVIGFIGLENTKQDVSWIQWFAVLDEYQGKGFGDKLINYVIKTAKKENANLICVETGSLSMFGKSKNLYKKYGFTENFKIKNYWKENDDLILLSKELK